MGKKVLRQEKNEEIGDRKRRFAELLCDPESDLTVAEIIKKVGVTRATLHRWLCDEKYSEYLNSLILRFADSEKANVFKSLIKKAKNGDVSAMKLYFDAVQKSVKSANSDDGVVIITGEDEIDE